GAPQQQRHAAHRSHAEPLDHSYSQFGDEAEAHAGSAEQSKLDQQPWNEDVVGTTLWETGRRLNLLEQGGEEEQVEERLDDSDNDPCRIVDEDPEVAAEHQPRVPRELHAATSRSERPVLRRKTSSRLGRCSPMVRSWSPEASSWRRMAGIATSPRSTYRRTIPSSTEASRTYGCACRTSRAACGGPAPLSVTPPPAPAPLS